MEIAKYGLNPGWHVICIKSDGYQKWVLRFRHTGTRIIEGQTGYQEPTYYDDNWEELAYVYDDFGEWYSGVSHLGRGVYRPSTGIVYDGSERLLSRSYVVGDYVDVSCWDSGFYRVREVCVQDGTVPSAVMGITPCWPGTLNVAFGAYYQGFSGDWSMRRPLVFSPSGHNDEQPWNLVTGMGPYSYPWMLLDQNDFEGGLWVPTLHSNFFFTAIPFSIVDEYPSFDRNYAIFQGPANWKTLNSSPPGQPTDFNASVFDWEWDCSCAESNMQIAYVRRKSDGSIWRFRNWNPTTGVYTDFPNLAMRPTNPVPNTEYASFFMNGPPIPGNETWNTLMILR